MFYVGQKVVCVDAGCTNNWGVPELTEGAVYIVRWVGAFGYDGNPIGHPHRHEEICLRLVGVRRDGVDLPFARTRFRPLVESKTDISIFTKMLTPTERVKEKQP